MTGTALWPYAWVERKATVLCKTERGVLIVDEFALDKDGHFINIPTKQEMLKTADIEVSKFQFLFYGLKIELGKKT